MSVSQNYVKAIVLVVCGGLICSTAMAQVQSPQVKKQVKKQVQSKPLTQARIKAPFKPKVSGIDPAVVGLRADIKRKLSPSTVQVSIVGVVQNIGSENYASGTNQQSVHLYEKAPGATDRLVAKKDFVNLKSGQKIEVTRTLSWSGSVEFPADYVLFINYDPDITLDGNTNNDDVKLTDNRRELKGVDITKKVQKYLASGGEKSADKAKK